MKTFIVIHPDLIYSPGTDPSICTLEDLPSLIKAKEPILFGIVPYVVGRSLGTERTIDVVVEQQYPGAYSFRVEPIETNVYQVYVANDELLGRLRALSRETSIVPYPAAVRQVISGMQVELATSLRERTRVFLQTITADLRKAAPPESVALDCLGEDYLITAVRGPEILAVRYVRGGDPVIEVQRTMASHRMDNPMILTKDEDLALELKAQGFTAQYADVTGAMIGLEGLEKALSLRFLTDIEVAREKARESRRKALSFLGVSAVVAGAAAAGFVAMETSRALAEAKNAQLTEVRSAQAARVSELYQERFATLARGESVHVREELFDLSIALPPQVALLSLEKDAQGLSAVVERRPGAAPFARADLVSALASSPFFARAQIQEEYEGHLVRYILKVPVAAAPDVQP